MQLDRMVNFHKVMGDVTRLRILSVLNEKSLCGMEIAERIGVTTATISHHMQKLKEVGVVYERRDKNTIYYYLDTKTLKRKAASIMSMIERTSEEDEKAMKEKEKVIKNFFTADMKLKSIPSQRKKKKIVFEKILEGLEIGKDYSEQEMNEYIQNFHEDYCTIRREFIINHYFHRQDGIYTLNPKEVWAPIE
jgi:DNA-binding transcriptional ArsR family regulator